MVLGVVVEEVAAFMDGALILEERSRGACMCISDGVNDELCCAGVAGIKRAGCLCLSSRFSVSCIAALENVGPSVGVSVGVIEGQKVGVGVGDLVG